MAPRFHRLRIADVTRETPDAISVAFDVPDALRDAYAFTPGQYLTLRAVLDGQEVRRSYSICSGLDDGELRIAIKRNPVGVFSVWANEALKPGDGLDVMTPTGRFGVLPEPDCARLHVAFAAGSGITPILSVMRSVLARELKSRFFLFYGSRATERILFRHALEDLKDRYLARLSLFHVLSREQQDLSVLNGRLDAAKVGELLQTMLRGLEIDHVFVCGPNEMIDGIASAVVAHGIPAKHVHTERFVSGHGGQPRAAPPLPPETPPHAIATLRVDGRVREVPVAEGEAVLDAALRAGLDLPYACKGGMCSTCRARLTTGRVEMVLNYALEPWEIDAGYVLTCQARPMTPAVTLDYDHV
jgi:ring-1,2-phenylacetyl-CoA epoxidase subunit PaaE